MINCRFCDIVNGSEDFVLWENDNFMLLLDTIPCKKGHCLLIPKKHVDSIFDLDKNLYDEMFSIIKKLEKPLCKVTNAKRLGLILTGFEIPHAHIHLVPLHGSNELFDEGLFKKADSEELKKVQEKIRMNLEKI